MGRCVCCWQESAMEEGLTAVQTNLPNKRRLGAQKQSFLLSDHEKCLLFSLHLCIDAERRLLPNKGRSCFVSEY